MTPIYGRTRSFPREPDDILKFLSVSFVFVRRTAVLVIIVISAIVAAEAALVAASAPPGIERFYSSLGILLTVTGCVILAGSFLALVGRRPMRLPGSQGVLVSSGTRSLWDVNRHPEQFPSKILAPVGIGSALFVLGLLFGLF